MQLGLDINQLIRRQMAFFLRSVGGAVPGSKEARNKQLLEHDNVSNMICMPNCTRE